MTHSFKQGDRVRITYKGRMVPGVVFLASDNGFSLMLSFQAMLGGYVGTMPVLWDEIEPGGYKDLIEWQPVLIEPETE